MSGLYFEEFEIRPGIQACDHAHDHGNRQPDLLRAHAQSAAAPSRRGICQEHRVRPAHREQHLHARADDRSVGRRHHARHHDRQPGHGRYALRASGVYRRHASRRDHGRRETREPLAARLGNRRVRPSMLQPARGGSRLLQAVGADAQEAGRHDSPIAPVRAGRQRTQAREVGILARRRAGARPRGRGRGGSHRSRRARWCSSICARIAIARRLSSGSESIRSRRQRRRRIWPQSSPARPTE